MNQSLELLRSVLAFLEKLSSDEMKRLAEGRAELRLVPAPKSKTSGRPASTPLSKMELAALRTKIEKQKAGSRNQSFNWLSRYKKDALWQLIKSYKFPPAVLSGLTPSKPKGTLIDFLQLQILGLATNKDSIRLIDLDEGWH